MSDEDIPRQLPELTGRHICASCLAGVAREEYFANDFMCAACADKADEYPLATTPHAPDTSKEIVPGDTSSADGAKR